MLAEDFKSHRLSNGVRTEFSLPAPLLPAPTNNCTAPRIAATEPETTEISMAKSVPINIASQYASVSAIKAATVIYTLLLRLQRPLLHRFKAVILFDAVNKSIWQPVRLRTSLNACRNNPPIWHESGALRRARMETQARTARTHASSHRPPGAGREPRQLAVDEQARPNAPVAASNSGVYGLVRSILFQRVEQAREAWR